MTTLTTKFDQVYSRLTSGRSRALNIKATAEAGNLSSKAAEDVIANAAATLTLLATVPRTAAVQTKAVEEWLYAGTLADDLAAIEVASTAIGDWVAARDDQLWVGYSIEATHPWTVTVPKFTSGQTTGLVTELDNFIAAVDVFLSKIG